MAELDDETDLDDKGPKRDVVETAGGDGVDRPVSPELDLTDHPGPPGSDRGAP